MSYFHPGIDSRHIIKSAMNSKSLGHLSREEDNFQYLRKVEPSDYRHTQRVFVLANKEDLENLRNKCKNKSPDEIFNLLGIKVEQNKDGSKSISHYCWPYGSYSFSSAGIDEEKLLEGVTEIKGDCDLTSSKLKNLGDVSSIYGNLTIPLFTQLEDLSNIKDIYGNIICDTENANDAIDLIKKLKLNPKYFGGHIFAGECENYFYYDFYSLPKDLETAIKELQEKKGY